MNLKEKMMMEEAKASAELAGANNLTLEEIKEDLHKFLEEGIWHKNENGIEYKWFYADEFIDKKLSTLLKSLMVEDKKIECNPRHNIAKESWGSVCNQCSMDSGFNARNHLLRQKIEELLKIKKHL